MIQFWTDHLLNSFPEQIKFEVPLYNQRTKSVENEEK